ncbi:hypothetical protein HT102_04325 [Hoyosella sp. G463]|uniref:Uncharacterized protein n=1 Tax=Lolliginicoccus lacisalsi TaxID=2742202 RepID=A0A927JBN5_9ACTN|nr:hypothetical protein [Lolliginicoccus lacisalsi]MBD8505712.1 hypothetical protein [Lolliginicoccus lacisalsi]
MAPRDTLLRRGRVVAAAGIVLGTGATLTLASWSDATFTTGTFGVGSFGIEASTDNGATWYQDEDILAFTVAAAGVRPGDTRYAPLSVRTESGSLGALATLGGATSEGATAIFDALRYRVVETNTCDASAFTAGASYLVGASSVRATLGTGSAPEAIALDAATASPGTARHYCFELHLPDTTPNWTNPALPGTTALARWPLTASSIS